MNKERFSESRIPLAVLGRTGLKITRLGYGSMEIYGLPPGRSVTEETAEKVLNTVLDEGINFIDTADCYGRSEEYIGKYTSGRRDEYYLATKGGCIPFHEIDWSKSKQGRKRWTADNLYIGLHNSLKLLKTDHIDLYQLHGPTVEECEKENLVDVLQAMRRQGKVRWIGISTSIEHMPVFLNWDVFDVFQVPYSAFSPAYAEIITRAANAGAGTIIRGGVAKGEPGDKGSGGFDKWRKAFIEGNLDELRESDESRTAFMLRFTLSHPDVHTVIAGTQNPDHVRENVRAAVKGPLGGEVYGEARRRLEQMGFQA